jgi:hypothetical protein
MSDLRVVQLKDKNNNPITPYTSAASVYVHVNEEWTNVETKIGGMDIDAIQGAQDAALDSIEEQRVASVNKIEEEGDSYRADINSLSGTVQTLDEKVFPLTITTSITPNYSTLKNSYTYGITEYGQYVTGTSVVVKRQSNASADETLYSGSSSHQTLTPSITWGRDIFKLSCVKGSKSSSKNDTRYLCVYGSYGETINASTLQNASVMSRILTTSASFSCTVNTTDAKKYIWVAVPEYLSISRITSAGFDVTMNNYVNIQIGSINYRAYRSKNPLQVSTWSLVIS